MQHKESLSVIRVQGQEDRAQVVAVLRAIYLKEKGWVNDPTEQIPDQDLAREDLSWFLAFRNKQPIGVLRVLYNPPLQLYAKYELTMLGKANSIDVDAFIRNNRIAEVGRFAVLTEERSSILAAAALMRAATEETVARGYTHYITDVFEDDPHSPYGFHTRVMGFIPVATHTHGELRSRSRRITLVLDLKAAYKRLKTRGHWLFRFLTGGWDERLHRRLAVHS
ncbi:hypothetical protein TI05_02095 [Achromatium sp. WMS3]|nr:hypothetical protein TI05_02095 [Achromatium sp. WMS3]